MITNDRSKHHEHCGDNLDFAPIRKGQFHEVKTFYFATLQCAKKVFMEAAVKMVDFKRKAVKAVM